jgi:hypothetical protein
MAADEVGLDEHDGEDYDGDDGDDAELNGERAGEDGAPGGGSGAGP